MTKLTFGTGCLRCAACAGRMGSIHLSLIFKKKKKSALEKFQHVLFPLLLLKLCEQ